MEFMPPEKIFSRFPHPSQYPLHTMAKQLYEDQQSKWPMLAEGVDALRTVQTRTVPFDSYTVTLQFNPKRIVSTSANVDAGAIKARRCFLCVDHLPPEQQGVLYHDQYLVLCNPMPIFREHFTISHIKHIPQSIEEQILPFLDLARDLSPRYSIFYNGPQCGASAPDHMHFQASPSGMIPVEQEAERHRRHISRRNHTDISALENYGRSVIILEGNDKQHVEHTFLSVMSIVRKAMNSDGEPKVNIIGTYQNNSWRLILFLRSVHRPSVYFKENEEKILISPASVDIGGLVITPMEKDFHRVDAPLLSEIFSEVSIPPKTMNTILELL